MKNSVFFVSVMPIDHIISADNLCFLCLCFDFLHIISKLYFIKMQFELIDVDVPVFIAFW